MSGAGRDGGYSIPKDYFIPQAGSPGGLIKVLTGKKYLWQMPLVQPGFTFVKQGKKRIEGRVPDFSVPTKDYRKMSEKDMIEFQLLQDNKVIDSVFTEVTRVRHYKSLYDFFDNVNFRHVMPNVESRSKAFDEYLKFPGYKERIQKNGIYAINYNILSNVKTFKSQPVKKNRVELVFSFGSA